MADVNPYHLTIIIIAAVTLSNVARVAAVESSSENNTCTGGRTCGTCLAIATYCHWCSDETFTASRCNLWLNLTANNCRQAFIVNGNSTIQNVKEEKTRNAQGAKEAVQLFPQEITAQLRPHESKTIELKFHLASDYPVDMYILMDMSNTMKDYKNSLADASEELAAKLEEITKNFQLGFGSFVDKVTLPFIDLTVVYDTVKDRLPPYSFRNRLQLTKDTVAFKNILRSTNTSSNLDSPEGGFDAIMQVLACVPEIGWRNNSRKLIIFFSDGPFHYAGDGRLAGIVVPNDGKCHLDNDGYYTESANLDYPSISQLADKLVNSSVHAVFAVVDAHLSLYKKLSARIEGSYFSRLQNASEVHKIVQGIYKNISSSVALKTEVGAGVNITWVQTNSSKCNLESGSPVCNQVEINETVYFKLKLQIDHTSCSTAAGSGTKTITISAIGFKEKLTINVTPRCKCACEEKNDTEIDEFCSKNGRMECGACTCNNGFYGKNCSCGSANLPEENRNATCIKPDSKVECELHGSCICGKCKCSTGPRNYYGDYCECNDQECPMHNEEPCGGLGRGVCKCGSCQCLGVYSGHNCDCLNSTAACRDSKGTECNNKGQCLCGKCVCNALYKGLTCEFCETCKEKCDERETAVLNCIRHGNCTDIELIDESVYKISDDWQKCNIPEAMCNITFLLVDTSHTIAYQTCAVQADADNMILIISVVIGAVLGLGIILLFSWKAYVTVHDRREYVRFEKELNLGKWAVVENAIYKEATTSFENPTFGVHKS